MTQLVTPEANSTSQLAERQRVVATMVAAFAADQVFRWFYPDGLSYLAHFPSLVDLMSGPSFEAGTADHTGDNRAAALWLPPGSGLDGESIGALFERSVDPGHRTTAFDLLEQVEAHHPTEAHWYLPLIGVDPSLQGRGVGSALLVRGLERADRDRLPAYLEASSTRNRALYERHGFEVTGEIRAGDSPPLWPMWRPAR